MLLYSPLTQTGMLMRFMTNIIPLKKMYKKTETPLIMIKGKIVFCMDNKLVS